MWPRITKAFLLIFLIKNGKFLPVTDSSSRPEENAGVSDTCLIEGDILCQRPSPNWLVVPRDQYRMWTSRIVPYRIHPDYSEQERNVILEAMRIIQEVSCVVFKEHQDENDFIEIQDRDGCFSYVGRIGGRQLLSLNPNCLINGAGIAIHELMHALGYWHEHNRYDRDNYVEIHKYNIMPNRWGNFEKKEKELSDLQGLDYDYQSILHYGPKMFAIDETQNTITPLNPEYADVIGQRERLSLLDVSRINRRYKCEIQTCPPPEDLPNGFRIGDDFSVGKTVRFECQERFFLIGSRYSFCRFDGLWSGTHPECYRLYGGLSCNFSRNCCGWAADRGNDLDWKRIAGSTPSSDTGPMVDHTSEASWGRYLYVDSSEFPAEGKRAGVVSPTLQSGTGWVCFRAYYYMWGRDVGRLNLYARFYNKVDFQIWTVRGNTGPEWIPLRLAFLMDSTPVQMVFEAILGSTAQSDVAIDDVLLEDCPHGLDHTVVPVEVPPPPLPVLAPDSAIFWCDFQQELCGQPDKENSDFDWLRDRGPTASDDTGPSVDHTYGTLEGVYLYVEASFPRREGDRARFLLPVIEDSGPKCLIFYYHMFGADVGSLRVALVEEAEEKVIWTREGNDGDLWRSARVDFRAESSEFRILFEGRRGAGPRGDLAIDDIAVVDGSCRE